MKRIIAVLSLCVCVLLWVSHANAQIPRTINYQGSLKHLSDGSPVTQPLTITFKLFDALQNGTQLWSETHQNVAVNNGIYNFILGSTPGGSLDTLSFDQPYFLQVEVGSDDVLLPRQQLTSVPYALRAVSAASLSTGTQSGTPTSDGFRIRSDNDFFGSNLDALVFEKTDGNDANPDGGMAFVNTGSDGIEEAALVVRGYGYVGVGTSTPAYLLDVNGQMRVSGHLLFGGSFLGGSDRGLNIYPNTNAYNSRAFIEAWGPHATRGGELAIGGTYIDLLYGSTNTGWGVVGLRLASNGNVGIGTTSPQYKLDVNGTIRGTNVSPSDIRFKKDVKPLNNALKQLTKLQGVSFHWKDLPQKDVQPQELLDLENKGFQMQSIRPAPEDTPMAFIEHEGDGPQIGLVAQEVERVFPEFVSTDSNGYKSVAYEKLVVPLIEAVKTLNTRNTRYQKEIESLKAENKRLKAEFERRLAALEAAINK